MNTRSLCKGYVRVSRGVNNIVGVVLVNRVAVKRNYQFIEVSVLQSSPFVTIPRILVYLIPILLNINSGFKVLKYINVVGTLPHRINIAVRYRVVKRSRYVS